MTEEEKLKSDRAYLDAEWRRIMLEQKRIVKEQHQLDVARSKLDVARSNLFAAWHRNNAAVTKYDQEGCDCCSHAHALHTPFCIVPGCYCVGHVPKPAVKVAPVEVEPKVSSTAASELLCVTCDHGLVSHGTAEDRCYGSCSAPECDCLGFAWWPNYRRFKEVGK